MADPQHLPAVVVALPTEIDMTNAGPVGEDLGSAFAPGVRTVIADMTATTFCDSSGISMLVRARKLAAANRTELRLVVLSAAVQRCLTLVQMDYLLPIYPSLSQALAAGPHARHERSPAAGGSEAKAGRLCRPSCTADHRHPAHRHGPATSSTPRRCPPPRGGAGATR